MSCGQLCTRFRKSRFSNLGQRGANINLSFKSTLCVSFLFTTDKECYHRLDTPYDGVMTIQSVMKIQSKHYTRSHKTQTIYYNFTDLLTVLKQQCNYYCVVFPDTQC